MVGGLRVREKALLTCKYVCCQHTLYAEKKGSSEVKASSVGRVGLEGGGGPIASHAGLFVVGGFAGSLGLGSALSAAEGHRGERAAVHDRGTVLTQLSLVLAGSLRIAEKCPLTCSFGSRENIPRGGLTSGHHCGALKTWIRRVQ